MELIIFTTSYRNFSSETGFLFDSFFFYFECLVVNNKMVSGTVWAIALLCAEVLTNHHCFCTISSYVNTVKKVISALVVL